jgi:hypothetical protein
MNIGGETVCVGVSVGIGSGVGVRSTEVPLTSTVAFSGCGSIPSASTVIAITVGRYSVGYGVGIASDSNALQLARTMVVNNTRKGRKGNILREGVYLVASKGDDHSPI